MDGGNFWQKLFDGLKAVPNNHTIDYFSAQPEDSQGKNRAEINGDDHQRFIHLSAQPGFSEDLSTADTDFEVNDNYHHALDSLQVQPGSSDSSANKATFDYMSAHQGSFQAPETSCPDNRRRKSPEGFDFLKSDKKRMADKAYRAKCKEERETTKAENNRLKTEINRLKEESDRKDHALKSQEEEKKHLQQKVRQLEGSLGQQNVVVEALTTQIGGSQNIDLQRENTLLKCRMDQLTSCANNKDNSVILLLQERNEQLQRDKSTLEKIVEALCLKINNDKNQDEEHTQ
ncbi:golgin subfamily member 8A [Salix suchowensis]|nr:golgin subfamily member 8A [Salix suchowensis]